MVGEKESIHLKSGQIKVRKYLTLTDDSNCSISVTLWGEAMCNRNEVRRVGEVLAVKSARASDFGGKSLNVADDHAQLFPDIDHPDTIKLKQWYHTVNMANVNNLTQKPNS